uniref:alanine--tRNA ligase n=2 Tax=Parascaris univalens TaxID=6257 RepID=A0A915B8Z4_PARUN
MLLHRWRQLHRYVVGRYFQTMSSFEVRESFLKFFMDRGHIHVPSSSIVPSDDPSLLFVTAGMNQFKSIILDVCGADDWRNSLRRAVNSQKCLRAGGKHNDLNDVGGDLSHHTFFEMLGNWSFGDYFKEEACRFAWEYLTEVLRLPPDRLYVTYYGDDNDELGLGDDMECREIWSNLGLHPSRIVRFGVEENFWVMAETGPCGPCSEIHYDFIGGRDASHLINTSDPSIVEIWNLVFMQYNRDISGRILSLPRRHVDCGMGFERIAAIMQEVRSNYDSDIFSPLISEISKYTNLGTYGGRIGRADIYGRDTAYRTIADHLRALCVAISDGVRPDAAGRGYVLRRMLRRAARMSSITLQADRGLLAALVPAYTSYLARSFPEIAHNAKLIEEIISSEESQFWKVVDRGERLFTEEAERSLLKEIPFSGDIAWYLHNTHGFPIELTSMLAEERNLSIDLDRFEECRNQAKMLRKVRANDACWRNVDTVKLCQDGIARTCDMGKYEYSKVDDGTYVFPERQAKILAIFSGEGIRSEQLAINMEGCVVVDETIFYAEQGGQLADNGVLCSSNGEEIFVVDDVQKKEDFVFLIGRSTQNLTVETDVIQKIDLNRRLQLMRAHTGTHLLLDALRILFGNAVYQRGSLVSPDRIRFDCSLEHALSQDQIREIERILREVIEGEQPVFTETVPRTHLSAIRNIQSTVTASLTVR